MHVETVLNEKLLIVISILTVHLLFLIALFLESKNIIPLGPSKVRDMFYTNRRKWILTVVPIAVGAVFLTWLCLRSLPAANPDVYSGIVYAMCAVMIGVAYSQFVAAKKAANEHKEEAKKHILIAEEHLKRLAEGPVILNEEFDAELMQARKQVIEVKEKQKLNDQKPMDSSF